MAAVAPTRAVAPLPADAGPSADRDAAAPAPADATADAHTAAALLAIDPAGLGGALLRARHGPLRSAWLARLRALLPAELPLKRAPLGIADDRLLGGLDLPATLRAGRPVAQQGLLAECHEGLLLLAMAERLQVGTAARLCAALDRQEVLLEREGLALRLPAAVGLVALDEGCNDDEGTPSALAERLALHLELDDAAAPHVPLRDRLPDDLRPSDRAALAAPPPDADADARADANTVAQARARLAAVHHGDDTVTALCECALALGVASLRAPWLALRAARAAAAWYGHANVTPEDTALAARLVLAPRATRWPAPAPSEAEPQDADPADNPPDEATPPEDAVDPPPPDTPPEPAPASDPRPPGGGPNADQGPTDPAPAQDVPLEDRVLDAARTALPAGLLARLKASLGPRRPSSPGGRAGALQASGLRGRPIGARRGDWRAGQRIDLVATLRCAAPWQALRRREALSVGTSAGSTGAGTVSPPSSGGVATHTSNPAGGPPAANVATAGTRVRVHSDDLHTVRHAQRRETTTVFVVDASGSAAMHRLAEAKGAVEQLLADCYVRRDRVALLVFRGPGTELVLPPTRSLVRAKRALAGQPGGGGTPLASALDAAADLTTTISRRGGTPVLVLLTDGRANIARNGQPGRAAAMADALASARRLRAAGVATLLVDTAPPSADATPARVLAEALAAVHLPLPQADPTRLARAVQAVAGS